ncbi:MAG: hypothetical protein R6X16_01730 [Anaerolineae bacterium]
MKSRHLFAAVWQNRVALVMALAGTLICLWGCRELRVASAVPADSPTLAAVRAPETSGTPTRQSTATVTTGWTVRPTMTPTVIALPTRAPTRAPTRTPAPSVTPTATTASAGAAQPPVAVPTGRQLPAVVMGPTVPLSERYLVGGLNLSDGNLPLSIAYPAAYDSDAMTRFDGLTILPVDFDGTNYRRFVTDYSHYVFIYGDALSGSSVLSVHDGTLRGSGRALEAEPLRQLIEGNLYAPYSLDVIRANLARLMGREWVLAQNGLEARFRLVKAARMNAGDVAFYQNQAAMLSTFVGGIPEPRRSFLMFFCSGRQPGEPSETFAGRYVLLLELVE